MGHVLTSLWRQMHFCFMVCTYIKISPSLVHSFIKTALRVGVLEFMSKES